MHPDVSILSLIAHSEQLHLRVWTQLQIWVGLVSGFYGGKLMCDLYANEPNPDLQLMSSPDKTGWLPPEPLRYLQMNVSLAMRHHRL